MRLQADLGAARQGNALLIQHDERVDKSHAPFAGRLIPDLQVHAAVEIEIARGLVNYDSKESLMIKGETSEKFESILGYVDEAELIHRDNLVLL